MRCGCPWLTRSVPSTRRHACSTVSATHTGSPSCHLSLGEHRVVDLTAHLGLAQSTVSRHLACLKDCGLVSSRPQGRASVFSLNHSDALMDLLAAAERLLDLTGDAVTLCANHGTAVVNGRV